MCAVRHTELPGLQSWGHLHLKKIFITLQLLWQYVRLTYSTITLFCECNKFNYNFFAKVMHYITHYI